MPKAPKLRESLTYANVMVTILAFIVLGGGAYAAAKLPKNSVGTKQLKKSSVTTAKIKKNAVNGAKVKDHSLTGSDINLAKLGAVPTAASADTAHSLSPLEGIHMVGAAGEPPFENGSTNFGSEGSLTYSSVGFYMDHEETVHLEGFAKVDAGPAYVSVFTLPPGYRPAGGVRAFEELDELLTYIGADGKVMAKEKGVAALEGIAFRAES